MIDGDTKLTSLPMIALAAISDRGSIPRRSTGRSESPWWRPEGRPLGERERSRSCFPVGLIGFDGMVSGRRRQTAGDYRQRGNDPRDATVQPSGRSSGDNSANHNCQRSTDGTADGCLTAV